MQRSLLKFENAIKSEATRKLYNHCMKKFLEWAKIKDADGLLQLKDGFLQELLEDYLFYQKKRLNPNSIPPMFAALELFFAMNDKHVDFKKIRKMFPGSIKSSGNGVWPTQDIQRMVEYAKSARTRALIYLLASTGCRIGAVPELKLKHLVAMANECKAIQFYEGTNDEYWGFLTPEANNALAEYLDQRKKDGEVLGMDTYVFRRAYRFAREKVRPVNVQTLKVHVTRVVKNARLNRVKNGKRYNIQVDNGFRKRFNTILKNNAIGNLALKEKLMGHKGVFALDGTYHNPDVGTLFEEFKNHIVNLTVDDSERDKIKIAKLEREKSELEKKTEEIEGLKKKFDLDHDLVQAFARMLKDTGVDITKPDGTNYEIDTPEIDYHQKYGIPKYENDPTLHGLANLKDLQSIMNRKGCTKV